jgi:hypothetical protein
VAHSPFARALVWFFYPPSRKDTLSNQYESVYNINNTDDKKWEPDAKWTSFRSDIDPTLGPTLAQFKLSPQYRNNKQRGEAFIRFTKEAAQKDAVQDFGKQKFSIYYFLYSQEGLLKVNHSAIVVCEDGVEVDSDEAEEKILYEFDDAYLGIAV